MDFWNHLEAILAPPGPPGGPLGSKCLTGPCLDPPRTLQENLLEAPGADLGSNLSQLGANLSQLEANLSQLESNLNQLEANLSQLEAI